MEGVTTGRVVHYTDPDTGHHLAAMIVHVHDKPSGLVNLNVFDNGLQSRHTGLKTSVLPGATPLTWHWPERA